MTSGQVPGHVLEIGPGAMPGTVHLRGNRVRPKQRVVLSTDALATLVTLANLHSTSALCKYQVKNQNINHEETINFSTVWDLPVMQ